MYVKFVFSNVIRELFQENRFAGEHRLDLEVDHLYGCSTIQEIIEVTEKNIRQYEEFLDRSMSESRDEVAAVKNYIYNHYAEDLNLETLAEKVYLSSGYLSFIFKKETGMNLNRYPCVPHGKGQGASTNHQHESSHGQRAGRICQFFVFLPELPGILRKQSGVLSERKQ